MRAYVGYLIDLIKDYLPTDDKVVGAEVGVWEGKASRSMLFHLPMLTLYMVDLWEELQSNPSLVVTKEMAEEAHKKAISATEFAGSRRLILFASSEKASQQIPDHALDFVFIDADHMYPSIYADLRLWFPKVRPGGLMIGHDYEQRWGVKQAVDEYAKEGKYDLTTHNRVWWFLK